MGERVLVVGNEPAVRNDLVRFLEERGHEPVWVADAESALAAARRGHHAVILADLDLPGVDGLDLLRSLRDVEPDAGILAVAAATRAGAAADAIRLGAHEILLGPLVLEEVGRKVDGLIRLRELVRENTLLRQEVLGRADPVKIVGTSPAIKAVRDWITRAVSTSSNVLVTGEPGTGKELVARAIHWASPLRDRPFVTVNVAAIPVDLVESHLFGHEKGAFPGAASRRDGLLGVAHGGMLLLDEVAELPLQSQAKLLRAIEEREFVPLGADRPVKSAVRVVGATRRDIEVMVERGAFRDDLYYRLNVVRIHVPPLRERPEDIPALATHLLRRHAAAMGRRAPALEPEALQTLMGYEWKGNVRELSNVLERALFLCDGDRLPVEALPRDVATRSPPQPTLLRAAVADFERRHIAWVLELAGGNRERAARLLGLSPATLYRRLDRLGLSRGRAANGRDSPQP